MAPINPSRADFDIDKRKAEVLLHGVMHDNDMSRDMKMRILRIIMDGGIGQLDLEYYLTNERWPRVSLDDNDIERDYKVRVTPKRRRAAMRNMLIIIAMIMFVIAFWTISDTEPTKETPKSTTSIE